MTIDFRRTIMHWALLLGVGDVAASDDESNDGNLSSSWPQTLLTTATFVTLASIAIPTLLLIWSRHSNLLTRELKDSKEQVKHLQKKLDDLNNNGDANRKEIRIFMDGAFDLMHYGHMNAFRLGRSLGTHLVVGVNSDESITECKAAPLMNDQERLAMVNACKFVDQVVPDCPYIMNQEYLQHVIDTYHIDYVVHGDDPCIVNGKDVYATAKAAGKYKSIPRTEGVSTTDIVGRMLLLTNNGKTNNNDDEDGTGTRQSQFLCAQSKFLTTSRMLSLFSAGVKAPTPGMKVVYIDGAWDMFHPGHVSLLKAAKEQGDFLIVGVHGDAVVNKVLGRNLPLMTLHERVLSVLGCRFVDDVLIDAPYEITTKMRASLNITKVLEVPDSEYGWIGEGGGDRSSSNGTRNGQQEDRPRYRLIPNQGRHRLQHDSQFNLQNIFQQIRQDQDKFQARFEKKRTAEQQFYETKHSLPSNIQ